MRKVLISGLMAISGLFLSSASIAAAEDVSADPQKLVAELTNTVLDSLRSSEKLKTGDSEGALLDVIAIVDPHLDFNYMTALAVGKDWRQATKEQKAALTKGFRALLLRSYKNAISQFVETKVTFKSFRGRPEDTDALVRTSVKLGARQAVDLDFRLEKTAGKWLVYDVSVAGVSLVSNYRSSFTEEIRKSGIDGLVKTLNDKNSTLGKS